MEKHPSIIFLIEHIKSTLSTDAIECVDYWKADLCAIGIKKKDRLIYISTYNYINHSSLTYDYDLEIEDGNDHKVIKEKRNVSREDLLNEIKTFLEL